MSESKTWLPRFRPEDFIQNAFFKRADQFVSIEDAAEIVNKRLEEFEATCVSVYCSKPDPANSHLWSHHRSVTYDTHESLLLPPRPIKCGVTKADILEALKKAGTIMVSEGDLNYGNLGKIIGALQARIEHEGIIE